MADNGPNPKIALVSGFGRLDFDPDTGGVEVEGLGALDVGVSVNGSRLHHVRTETPIQSPLMGRIVQHLAGHGAIARLCWDAHTTGNLHLYASVRAESTLVVERVELPRVALGDGAAAAVDQAVVEEELPERHRRAATPGPMRRVCCSGPRPLSVWP